VSSSTHTHTHTHTHANSRLHKLTQTRNRKHACNIPRSLCYEGHEHSRRARWRYPLGLGQRSLYVGWENAAPQRLKLRLSARMNKRGTTPWSAGLWYGVKEARVQRRTCVCVCAFVCERGAVCARAAAFTFCSSSNNMASSCG
jgi:hypothetical protein